MSSSVLLFEIGSLTEPRAHRLGENSWPESAKDSLVPVFTQITVMRCHTHMAAVDLSSGSHTCGAGTLPSEHPSGSGILYLAYGVHSCSNVHQSLFIPFYS